eukprot:GHVU01093350.1.p1 GENE.GHVU01093350.1~~GHVU01093350.1.p1  ORF type:complete len:100 (+),score=3.72 GHVU01093350.1:200-499(+)
MEDAWSTRLAQIVVFTIRRANSNGVETGAYQVNPHRWKLYGLWLAPEPCQPEAEVHVEQQGFRFMWRHNAVITVTHIVKAIVGSEHERNARVLDGSRQS